MAFAKKRKEGRKKEKKNEKANDVEKIIRLLSRK